MDISPFNINRLYYGGGLDVEAGGEVPFEEMGITIFGNIGYRWRTAGRIRFMNVGAHLGANYDIYWEELMVFAMAELSFGWDLGNSTIFWVFWEFHLSSQRFICTGRRHPTTLPPRSKRPKQ